jgi:hypothetical protein
MTVEIHRILFDRVRVVATLDLDSDGAVAVRYTAPPHLDRFFHSYGAAAADGRLLTIEER